MKSNSRLNPKYLLKEIALLRHQLKNLKVFNKNSDTVRPQKLRGSKHSMKLFQVSLMCAFSISCVKKSETSGNTKYAQMDDFGGYGFAELLPNQSVSICANGETQQAAAMVKDAFLEWAAAIGRDKYLKVDTNCGSGNMKVNLYVESCEAAAYTSPEGQGQFKIAYCSPEHVTAKDINLHEVGHIWMQCDRYSQSGDLSQAKFGDGCSSQYSDGKELPSAMMAGGPSHPKKVTEDDVNAMRALAKRTDISANSQWTNFQNLNQAPGTYTPPQNNQNPSQPAQMGASANQQQGCAALTQRLQYESRYRPLTQQEYVALALCGLNGLAGQLSASGGQPSGS